MLKQEISSAAETFAMRIPVRFADCDPAGIVFYPRYFEMFNSVVEDWCAAGLGLSFRQLHVERRLGFPTVHIETDFVAPSMLGDVLRAELAVQEMGRTSVTLTIMLSSLEGEIRVCGRLILALIDLESKRAVPIPERMRARMASFLSVRQ